MLPPPFRGPSNDIKLLIHLMMTKNIRSYGTCICNVLIQRMVYLYNWGTRRQPPGRLFPRHIHLSLGGKPRSGLISDPSSDS